MSERDSVPRRAPAPMDDAIGRPYVFTQRFKTVGLRRGRRSGRHLIRPRFIAVAMLLAVAPCVGVGSDGDRTTTIIAAQAATEQRGTAPPCCTGTLHVCSCHVAAEPPVTTVPTPTSVSRVSERTVEAPAAHGERSRVFRPPRVQLVPEEFEIS